MGTFWDWLYTVFFITLAIATMVGVYTLALSAFLDMLREEFAFRVRRVVRQMTKERQ